VIPSWNERQPSQDGGDWHNVDEHVKTQLIFTGG
jgi:hypothetical protein